MWQNEDDLEEPRLVQLRHQKKFPSLATCHRWIHQYATEGNVLPKRNSGNRFATREVHGQDIVNLALYRMCRPKAYVDEVRAYVHNRNIANPPYSRSQIYRAEQRLGLYRKPPTWHIQQPIFTSASNTGATRSLMVWTG